MDSFVNINSYSHGGFKVVIVAVLLIVMLFLMVGGRLTSRKLQKVKFGADDYVLLLATVLTFGLCALAIAFPRVAGIGAQIGGTQVKQSPEGKLLGQSFMAWMVVYGLSTALSKSAILLLYIRVFTTSNRVFTAGVGLIGFVVISTGIVNTFMTIFQCSPIAYGWYESGGSCIDEVALARYTAISTVISGAIMLIMPIPLVWRLNLVRSAKIALTATFLHGIIGFIASWARLVVLFRTKETTVNSYTSIVWTIWTINEPANYVIAACLPTLRPVFLRIFPSSFFILSQKRRSKPYTPAEKLSPIPQSPASDSPSENPLDKHPTQCDECWVDIEA